MIGRASLRSALVLLLGLGNSGCGVLLQTAFGWSEEQTQRDRVVHSVRVDTPEGANVTRIGPNQEAEALGPGPLVDDLEYEKVVVRGEPRVAGLIIGGILSAGAGAGLAYAASSRGDDCGGAEVCFETAGTLATTGYVMGATLAILGAMTDLTVALIYGLSGGGVKASRVEGPTHYVYRAELQGAQVEAAVDIPDRYRVTLRPGSTPADPTLVAAPPAPAAANQADYVIAVMEVEDVNARTDKALDRSLVRNLGDQLRIFVAQSGARTIDRSAQQTALKSQIDEMKGESYAACYDDACQIELGKALAASHILRARITQFGARCVLNAELIDLREEVTIKAASARGGCEAEGFLTMAERVAQRVVE